MPPPQIAPRYPRRALPQAASGRPSSKPVRRLLMPAAFLAIMTALALLPHRLDIPPQVGPDYAYMLIGADRLYEGLGFTSLQPVAPLQPWEYRCDWGWLAQWPVGYPLIVAGLRVLLGFTTIQACQWISVAGCALALVGWFAWLRRSCPRGAGGVLLALAGAGCSVSTFLLLTPTTDLLLIATVPYVLLLAYLGHEAASEGCKRRARLFFVASALMAGGMFWIRYAAIFLPVGVELWLCLEWLRRRVNGRDVMAFGLASLAPVLLMLAVNRVFGGGADVQEQMNLGQSIGFHVTWAMLGKVWYHFTDLGYYDHRGYSHWVFAGWPVVMLGAGFLTRTGRGIFRLLLRSPQACLSGLVALSLFSMLIASTALFGNKFNYIDLDRYYEPARPLYFLLFVAPIFYLPLWWRRQGTSLRCPPECHAERSEASQRGEASGPASSEILRCEILRCAQNDDVQRFPLREISTPSAASMTMFDRLRRLGGGLAYLFTCLGLCVACAWTVQQEWPRPYKRWLAANRERTDYGDWATCLGPDAQQTYDWLCQTHQPGTIIFSNYHDYITLHTGIPALPIPGDREALNGWIARVCQSRAIDHPHILFVLDANNGTRNYYLPERHEIVARFALCAVDGLPADHPVGVYEYVRPSGIAKECGEGRELHADSMAR